MVSLVLGPCSCHPDLEQKGEFHTIPSEISKRIVFSEKCGSVLFSTNESNYFHPYIIDDIQSNENHYPRALDLKADKNRYVRDISCDCSAVVIAEEDVKHGKYDVVIFNLIDNTVVNITKGVYGDSGNALFSPVGHEVSFLAQRKLKIYNYRLRKFKDIANPDGVDFKHTIWSFNGVYIYLEDQHSNIWQYDIQENMFTIYWEAPKPFQHSRLLTPSRVDDQMLFFVSDHESDFNQIYKIGDDHKAQLYFYSNEDKFLFQKPILEENFVFKSSKDGEYVMKNLGSDGKEVILNPSDGVVYDYVHVSTDVNLLIWSNFKIPASLFRWNGAEFQNLFASHNGHSYGKPQLVYNQSGMFNLVFMPKETPKKWVVWLHGGPHEQISVRYNSYISSLLDTGFAVIALNYPGSTGIGNAYELRDKIGDDLLSIQVKTTVNDLKQIIKSYDAAGKLAIIGVSYGSKIAHRMVDQMENEISHLIDFSGVEFSSSVTNVPILYLFGEYDYALGDPRRIDLINCGLRVGNAKATIFKNEGHSVSQKKNIYLGIERIRGFLIDNY